MKSSNHMPFPGSSFYVGPSKAFPVTESKTEEKRTDTSEGFASYRSVVPSLMSGFSSSLSVSEESKQQSSEITVHFKEGNAYPFVFIAQNDDPELLKKISADPEIKRLIEEFQDTLINTYEESTADFITRQHVQAIQTLVTELVEKIQRRCCGEIPFLGPDNRSPQVTFNFAVPFPCWISLSSVIVTGGTGQGEVFLRSLDGQANKLPNRSILAFESGNVLFAATDGLQQTVRNYNQVTQKLTDDNRRSELQKSLSVAANLAPEPAQEEAKTLSSNQVYAITQKITSLQAVSVADIAALPNQEVQQIASLMQKVNRDYEDNEIKGGLEEIKTKKTKRTRKLATEKSIVNGLGSITYVGNNQAKIRVLEQKLKASAAQKISLTQEAKDRECNAIACVEVVLDAKRWTNEKRWESVATPQMMLAIIRDVNYWKSKTTFKKSVPTGVEQMQKKINEANKTHALNSSAGNLQNTLPLEAGDQLTFNAMKPIAEGRQYRLLGCLTYWTYHLTTRDKNTQQLYDVLSKTSEEPLHQDKNFQALFTDWVRSGGLQRMEETQQHAQPAPSFTRTATR